MDKSQTLLLFWKYLKAMSELSFKAGNHRGRGKVTVASEDENVLVYTERGTWVSHDDKRIDFSNALRWTLHLTEGLISLQHLRRGPNYPVTLVDLVPVDSYLLSSVACHICGADIYSARLSIVSSGLLLGWKVTGPKKNDKMEYYYS